MTNIHPTAMIHKQAVVPDTVTVGAYSMIGENVVLGDNIQIAAHVVIDGHTNIGAGTKIFSFASLGSAPQDLKYKGEAGKLEIGQNNTIREHVTMNIGTEGGGMLTKIGDNNLLMVGVHIGHDCHVGSHVILVNNATLAGHVEIDDFAVLGGLCAVHQFCRIGKLAMIGGMTGVEHDVIPYGTVMGNRATLRGLNLIGLERAGHQKSDINILRSAYKKLFDKQAGSFDERMQNVLAQDGACHLVKDVLNFLSSGSKRRFCMPE